MRLASKRSQWLQYCKVPEGLRSPLAPILLPLAACQNGRF